MRLGLGLCVPHQRFCGSLVSSVVVHSFVCKKAPGRTARHHALNDLIAYTLSLQAYLSPKNPMACQAQMANVLKASIWCREKMANPFLGTHLSSAPWQTLAVYVSERRALRRRRRHSVRRPSMRLCCEFVFLRRLLWNCWGLWKKRLRHFRPSWVTGSRHCLEIVVRLAFCFNGFLFLCSDLTPFCCGSFTADSCPDDDL